MSDETSLRGQLQRIDPPIRSLGELSRRAGYQKNYVAWARCNGRLTASLVARVAKVLGVDRTTARVILGLPWRSK